MKKSLTITFTLLFSTLIFSQAEKASKKYITVILDGKPVLMNVKTGAIEKGAHVSKEKGIKKVTNQLENSSVNNTTHVVAAGETLYAISKQYGITVKDIYKANSLLSENSSLRIGQVLNLNSQNIKNITNDATADSFHIVKTGDTLYNLSKRSGISVAELIKKNTLTSNILAIGQKLKL